MKFKKALWGILPAATLAFGAIALASMPKQSEPLRVEAADYTRTSRSITKDETGIHATFNVSNYDLGDLHGWLLCLLNAEPPINNAEQRKIVNSANLHPYTQDTCVHYFLAESSQTNGKVTVTWAADATDQKENWVKKEKSGVEGAKTLAECLDEGDWYLVIGPRYYYGSWGIPTGAQEGEGKDHIWENLDYYVGRESNVLSDSGSYGETYLDLSEYTGWESDDAKFAIYYFDGTNDGWSDFMVKVDGLDHIYLASYELGFTPTQMIGVRLNKDATTPNWDDKWNQTGDLDFHSAGIVGVYSKDDAYDAWSGELATVDFTGLKEDVLLDHYKRNSANHSEHYNESITLAKDDEFVIKLGDTSYNTFTVYSSIEGAFSLSEGEDKKIVCNVAGSYAFYFDATAHSLYLTDPIVASADEWAQSFLSGDCTATKTNWATLKTSYKALPADSKSLLRDVTHEPDPNKKVEGWIGQAVQRYDWVLTVHGTTTYDDFMGRLSAGKLTLTARTASPLTNNASSTIIMVVVIAAAAATLAGVLIFANKRKNRA